MANGDYVKGLVAGQVAILKDLQADLDKMLYRRGARIKGEGAVMLEEVIKIVDRRLAAFEPEAK